MYTYKSRTDKLIKRKGTIQGKQENTCYDPLVCACVCVFVRIHAKENVWENYYYSYVTKGSTWIGCVVV